MSSPTLLPTQAANIGLEISINAPVSKTWKAMIEDVGSWWRQDFLACEGSLGMNLEPRIGGKLFEKLPGEGCGFVWGSVISFQPEKHLAYVAQIVPPWGGPAQSVVQLELAATGVGTLLKLTDSIVGHLSEDMLCCIEEGWGQLYGEGGLKTYVEGL